MNDATAHAAAAVSARDLRKAYDGGRIVALDGACLDISAGESVAIVGPSGCGKSTLMNLIAAMDRPDEGELSVFGCSVPALKPKPADEFRARTIGFVFQLHNLLPHLTAHENVQVPMLRPDVSALQRAERATRLLERVGLAERMDSLPTELSGGERQRVAVARALANRPRLILADEPTGSLDSKTEMQVLELLGQIRSEDGVTLLIVTHDAQVARSADRTIHMVDGRTLVEGDS